MKFERVDEKTVRCFISNEELEGYQIDYKDFVMRSEKAREVVREIIEQATEVVGYKPPKFAFDMSIMMMPDQGLVLTFSENDPLEERGGKLMEYLKEMKRALQNVAEIQQAEAAQPEPPVKQVDRAIFAFRSIGDIMELAALLPKGMRVHSELYRMDEKYYLYLEKGTASYRRFGQLCIHAMEFGEDYAPYDQNYTFLQEHGECLISGKALRKLNVEKTSSAKRPEDRGEKKLG